MLQFLPYKASVGNYLRLFGLIGAFLSFSCHSPYDHADSPLFNWETKNGEVTITRYNRKGGDVVIPAEIGGKKVTVIGKEAFYNCINLISIILPDSVTAIGNEAFSYCTGLAAITLPDSVTTIGNGAFSDCTSLTAITLPDNITAINDSAFYKCSSLTSIIMGDSVTSIGTMAFSECISLTNITIPSGITRIEDNAFYDCTSLTSVTFEGSVPPDKFSDYNIFPGDLQEKYLEGGMGNYTRPDGTSNTWTKQQSVVEN